MGNRANIVILQPNDKEIYFYTHWRGDDIKNVLKDALIRGKDRWYDEPYLARIIFCELVKGSEMDSTGFGITTYFTDSEHNLLVVDVDNQLVWEAVEGTPRQPIKGTIKSFTKFIE